MRHGSHQMTTLILAHKDDNVILELSALCVRSALVNKLHYTNVSCEWVSCLHYQLKTASLFHCILGISPPKTSTKLGLALSFFATNRD